MRILFIANTTLSVHDLKWMSFFSEQDGIDVFATDSSGMDFSSDETLLPHYNKTGIEFLLPMPLFSPLRFLRRRKGAKILRKYIREHKIDIVHILFATPTAPWGLYCEDIPFVITTRGSDVIVHLNKLAEAAKSSIRKKQEFALYKRAFTKAVAITSTSNKQAEIVNELFGRESSVIRTGVDVEKISGIGNEEHLPDELKGKKFILSPRWIRPIYDTNLQIDAIRLLDTKILEEYTFVFLKYKELGKEYVEEAEKRLAETEGLKYVVYDHLHQEQMHYCFANAALAIMTPLHDGSPNSALEAMASRCPLIMSDLDYDVNPYGGTCLRLEERSPQALADLIIGALNEYPEGLLEVAYNKVKEHGNRPIEMGKMLDIYHRIISKD